MYADLIPEDCTPRALLGGLLVGTLLCCTNLYLGLQSAFITMASMQAALVGFGLLRLYTSVVEKRARRNAVASNETFKPFTAQENSVLQATAVSLGAMPLCAGLIGIVPAFSMLSPEKDGKDVQPFTFTWSALIVWCTSMAFFGIFFASPMRKPMIVQEKLRFPSGSATAQLICVLHRKSIRSDNDSAHTNSNVQQEEDVVEDDDEEENVTMNEQRPLLRRSQTESEQEQQVHDGWTALLITFAVSAFITIASFVFPVLYAIPAFDVLLPCHDAAFKWGWYITPSLSYVGQGIIMGPQTTISLFTGAVVGWAFLSPLVHRLGWTNGVPTDAEAGSQAWLTWLSLAIMTSESVVGLIMLGISHNPSISRWLKKRSGSTEVHHEEQPQPSSQSHSSEFAQDCEPASRLTPTSWIKVGLLLSTLVSTGLLIALFRRPLSPNDLHLTSTTVSVWVPFVGVVLAGLLSVVAVRALAVTDLNPVSALGKLSQLAFAILQPGNVIVNMIGGALSEAGAQQAGELMQDFKTGHLVHASPRGQFFGQVIGSTAGIFVSATAYKLYERAYKLPGPEMPAPAARIWLNFARLINKGALPPHSGSAMCVAAALFAFITLCKSLDQLLTSSSNRRASPSSSFSWQKCLHVCVKYLPNGIAFAVGLGLNTPNYSLARLVGGMVVLLYERRQRNARRTSSSSSSSLPPVSLLIWSAGFVLGEGFASIVLLLLKTYGLGPLSCWGCRGGCGGGC